MLYSNTTSLLLQSKTWSAQITFTEARCGGADETGEGKSVERSGAGQDLYY